MNPAIAYSIKVWMTSVVLGSFIANLPFILQFTDGYELITTLLGGTLLMMLVAALFSIVSWVVLALCTHLLIKRPFEVTVIKAILSLIGIILALAPLLLLTGGKVNNDFNDNLTLIAYPATIVAGIWFYQLKPNDELN